MHSYERFMAALRLEKPDRVPVMELEESVRQKILPGVSLLDFYEQIDLDAIVIFEDIPWQDVAGEVKRDHFGMHSSFIYPAFIRGIENLLMDYVINPEFAEKLTGRVVDYFVALERQAIEAVAVKRSP
jgi:hypothetical protein